MKVIGVHQPSFYELLVEAAKKNTRTNEQGLTTINEDDVDYYDTIWDNDDAPLVSLNESVSVTIAPKAKDIWKVTYPHEENDGKSTERPVLVLDINHSTAKILSMKITSNMRRMFENNPDNHDIYLNDYRHEGLTKPSVVRVDKVIEIDKSQFISKYGVISDKDWDIVYDAFMKLTRQN